MELGLTLGYQTAWTTPADQPAFAQEADRLGFSVVWPAEADGSAAPSIPSRVAGQTSRLHLGTAITQIPARTPVMTVATIDTVMGGRFRLGPGVSGAQVSAGWPGVRFDEPLARTTLSATVSALDGPTGIARLHGLYEAYEKAGVR